MSSDSATMLLKGQVENYLNRAGYHQNDLTVVRVGTRTVLMSPKNYLVIRVHNSSENIHHTHRWNIILEDIRQRGANILTPIHLDPIMLPCGFHVTFWPLGTPDDDALTHLPTLIASLHNVDVVSSWGIPYWDPLQKVIGKLIIAEDLGVPVMITDGLGVMAERLWSERPDFITRIIHSDAHAANIISLNNVPLLVDLDDISWGPAEADIAPTVVAARHFGLPDRDLVNFLSLYGRGNVDDNVLTWCADFREIMMVAWVTTLWISRPDTRTELMKRRETIGTRERWHSL